MKKENLLVIDVDKDKLDAIIEDEEFRSKSLVAEIDGEQIAWDMSEILDMMKVLLDP